MAGNEGGASVRTQIRVEVTGRVFVHNDEKLFIAPLVDLSEGGCFIGQLTSLKQGAKIRAVIKCPALEQPIQILGQVIRVENGARVGAAVSFTRIASDAQRKIVRLVQKMKDQTSDQAEAA